MRGRTDTFSGAQIFGELWPIFSGNKFLIVDISDTSSRMVTKFCTVRGLTDGNLQLTLDRGYNTIKHCDKTAKTVLAVLSQLF